MEDQINIKEEILNLRKELSELKNENKVLHQKINEQSLEIQNLKNEYNKDINKVKKEYKSKIEEMISEINSLKDNMKISNNVTDNAPPLSNFMTPSSSNNDKNIDNIQTTKGETETGEYITSVSFFLSNSIDLSVAQLNYYGFKEVEGDIRKGAGDLFCVLGCKYEKNQPFITNIIGSVNDNEEPVIIYENGIKYTAIKDPLNNSDIHKGSNGNFLCLYYTNDPKAGKPIKNLRTESTNEILNYPNIVKYCMRNTSYNKPCEPLDCNRGRSSLFRKTPQNYIFIERD
jgi:hypothetical protein